MVGSCWPVTRLVRHSFFAKGLCLCHSRTLQYLSATYRFLWLPGKISQCVSTNQGDRHLCCRGVGRLRGLSVSPETFGVPHVRSDYVAPSHSHSWSSKLAPNTSPARIEFGASSLDYMYLTPSFVHLTPSLHPSFHPPSLHSTPSFPPPLQD